MYHENIGPEISLWQSKFQQLKANMQIPTQSSTMEHLTFHHNGKEYTVHDALTPDEVKAIMTMGKERYKKLDSLNAKSTRKYFEDTDKMVAATLRKCFKMTDKQITEMEEIERRNLASSFVRYLAAANNFSS